MKLIIVKTHQKLIMNVQFVWIEYVTLRLHVDISYVHNVQQVSIDVIYVDNRLQEELLYFILKKILLF